MLALHLSDTEDYSIDHTNNNKFEENSPLLEPEEPKTFVKMNSDEQHCHSDIPERTQNVQKAKKKLIIACGLCLLFIAGEVTGGYLSQSLAVMSDAAHMFSDFASFLVSLLAIQLGTRRPSKRYTYGLYRAEVLGAFITVMFIWFVSGILLYLACHRIAHGEFDVNPDPMIAVAVCAVFFNIILGVLLHGQGHGHSHGGSSKGHTRLVEEGEEQITIKTPSDHEHINIRAAFIHVIGDLIQSIGVLISSVIIKIRPDFKYADPICTILFTIIVFVTTVKILRDTVLILLESNHDTDYDLVFNDLFGIEHVVKVHDLHIWSLTTDQKNLSAHLAVDCCTNQVQREEVLQNAIKMLRNRHQIYRTTIQIENYQPSIMNDCQKCQSLS